MAEHVINSEETLWIVDPDSLGEDIIRMRQVRNMSQRDLAKQLHHTSVSALNNWEYGTCLPNLANLLEICSVFGITELRLDTTRRWYS